MEGQQDVYVLGLTEEGNRALKKSAGPYLVLGSATLSDDHKAGGLWRALAATLDSWRNRMSKMMTISLMLALAGCATDTEPKMTAEALAPLVREYAFQEMRKLNPQTQFKIEEYEVSGLWHALEIQLFLARYMSPNGDQFNEGLFIYSDGKITPFASASGGHGLMSAVLMDDKLYYTYSWGSGRHRSHVGRVSVDDAKITITESGGYAQADLFIKKVNGKIQVEVGRFTGFNSWEAAEKIGCVKIKASSLVIVDAAGAEVPARFAIMKQGIQQPTEPDKK